LVSLAFNGFLLTPGGKRIFKPGLERRFSVESFETNTLSRLSENEVKARTNELPGTPMIRGVA
jgi:hypothetical protein